MRHPDGLEVKIRSLDRDADFKQYPRPGHVDVDTMERYIEVTEGERFELVITLTKDFKYFASRGVRIAWRIDQGQACGQRFMPAKKGRPQTVQKSMFIQFIDGKWVKGCAVFGRLDIDHDLFHNNEDADRLASTLGIVSVRIARGRWEERAVRRPITKGLPSITNSSKEIVKGRHADMAIRPSTEGTREISLHRYKTKFHPYSVVSSPRGSTEYIFNFRYRSSFALGKLGILPGDSESPAPLQNNAVACPSGSQSIELRSQARNDGNQQTTQVPTIVTQTHLANSPTTVVKMEPMDQTVAIVGTSTSVQHHSTCITDLEDMGKEDLQLELRKIELQERKLEIQQRLRRLQRNNAGTGPNGVIILD